jgi:hypothetical protein
MKEKIKKVTPVCILHLIRKFRIKFLKSEFNDLSVEQSFVKIYNEKRWGIKSGFFFFGKR